MEMFCRLAYCKCIALDKRVARRQALTLVASGALRALFEDECGMNRFEPRPMGSVEARVQYLDGDFRVVRPGAFVRCAATGAPIPLDELRYWSVDLQEAYANPDAVLRRLESRP
jgi:hypothetical protein